MHRQIYLVGLIAATAASAAQVGYYDANKCVDPSGFESCYKNVDAAYADCINKNCKDQNIDCHNVCACIGQEKYIDCAVQSCWNQVYSCEYQRTVSDMLDVCLNPPLDDIPFWPAPANAPGGCSCNIGEIDLAVQVAAKNMEEDCNFEKNKGSLTTADEMFDYGRGCICCSFSAILSAIPNICPSLSLAELEMEGMDKLLIEKTASSSKWGECGAYMKQYDCVDTFGYPDELKTYYGPGEVPKGGTKTLSNTSGSITSPLGGATVTWTPSPNLPHTITVASAKGAKATAASGSEKEDDESKDSSSTGSGDSGSGNSGSETSTATGSSPSETNAGVSQISTGSSLLTAVGVCALLLRGL